MQHGMRVSSIWVSTNDSAVFRLRLMGNIEMKNKTFYISGIANGTLDAKAESDFYFRVRLELLKIICSEHDFNPLKLSKGEVLRLEAHIDNIASDKYEELKGVNRILLAGAKSTLSVELVKTAQTMTENCTASLKGFA